MQKIEQLKKLMTEIFDLIELRLKREQIDLKEVDNSLDTPEIIDDVDIRESFLRGREEIVKAKSDNSFWKRDVPNLISLLENSKEKIQNYRKDLSEIGGKNSPNPDIIQLITQGILTTETPISNQHKGKEFTGHLTADGYLELEVNGIKKKLSLRKASLSAWESDPPNQWKFWKAPDNNGKKKPLEYFRRLIN